ncbi:MAG: hypothetical protein LQ344_007586 [Seirophora lacunosa]|nr:MAG: hypothetical protein LQ344_007586 [Seirophora lacunosa]
MALSIFNLTSLVATTGLPSLGATPYWDGAKAICGATAWGTWKTTRDCIQAVNKLPTGNQEVEYTIDRRQDYRRFHLPQAREAGGCQIQVEMAGENLPLTVRFTPDHIRQSAMYMINTCATKDHMSGGFLISNLDPVVEFLTSRDGDLTPEHPIPPTLAYPTISMSIPQVDWLSPGNFDPLVANLLADGLFDRAKKLSPTSLIAARMRSRAMRLLKEKEVMTPRGKRIPWWSDPDRPPRALATSPQGNPKGDAMAADAEAALRSSRGAANEGNGMVTTARKARRRKRVGEEVEAGDVPDQDVGAGE